MPLCQELGCKRAPLHLAGRFDKCSRGLSAFIRPSFIFVTSASETIRPSVHYVSSLFSLQAAIDREVKLKGNSCNPRYNFTFRTFEFG